MVSHCHRNAPATPHCCLMTFYQSSLQVGQAYRSSDDGEPGGTAGRPILAAIEGEGLDSVAVLVTRQAVCSVHQRAANGAALDSAC